MCLEPAPLAIFQEKTSPDSTKLAGWAALVTATRKSLQAPVGRRKQAQRLGEFRLRHSEMLPQNLWWNDQSEAREVALRALPVLGHVATNVRVRRPFDFSAVGLWLHSADLFQCSMNDCHSFRSFLLLSRAEIMRQTSSLEIRD